MIHVFVGNKGAGKTKRMISYANDDARRAKGHIIYVSDNLEDIFQLNSNIRLVDLSNFTINSVDNLKSFIYGIISQDYDIDKIFIDNLSSILNDDSKSISKFMDFAGKLGLQQNIDFILGINNIKDEYSQYKAEYIAV